MIIRYKISRVAKTYFVHDKEDNEDLHRFEHLQQSYLSSYDG